MDRPGWNCLTDDIYYRKIEVYKDCWDFEFSALKIFGCQNGGPIGLFRLPLTQPVTIFSATARDESKFVQASDVSRPAIDFYTCSGIALASIKVRVSLETFWLTFNSAVLLLWNSEHGLEQCWTVCHHTTVSAVNKCTTFWDTKKLCVPDCSPPFFYNFTLFTSFSSDEQCSSSGGSSTHPNCGSFLLLHSIFPASYITVRDGTVVIFSSLGEEIRKFNLDGVRVFFWEGWRTGEGRVKDGWRKGEVMKGMCFYGRRPLSTRSQLPLCLLRFFQRGEGMKGRRVKCIVSDVC